jgi:hypothetical protein
MYDYFFSTVFMNSLAWRLVVPILNFDSINHKVGKGKKDKLFLCLIKYYIMQAHGGVDV